MRQVRRDGFGQLQELHPQAISRRVPLRKKAHLCPDCAEDLRKWMKGCEFTDTGKLREVVAEIEDADVDGTGDWPARIRKAVGL